MRLDQAFALWDWGALAVLLVVGLMAGYVLLPFAWPSREASGLGYPSIMASVLITLMFGTFFAFLIVFRYMTTAPDIASRTIGTACQGGVFGLATGAGLHLRTRR